MKRLSTILFALLCFSSLSYGQLSGIKTVGGVSPDYATISAAVTALNVNGVAFGGVTFNIVAGHTETANNLTITTTTGADTSTIVFQKSGIGANPLITAAPGTSTTVDGIIKIAGTDYITFDGIDLLDPTTNTTTTTRSEWGYAILKGSAMNGAQHVTIRNCTVTLQKAYASTKAIYCGNHLTTSASALTVTNQTGTNSYIDIYGNNLTNCYTGIYTIGATNATYYDDSLRIGTYGQNVITNFGGTTTIAYGIYVQNFKYAEIMNDSVNGGVGTTRDLIGIYAATGTNCNALIQNNYIQIGFSPSSYDGYGIYYAAGTAANTVVIDHNTIKNCSIAGSISDFFSIWVSTPAATTISNNTVGFNTGSMSIGSFYQIYTVVASATLNIHSNTIMNNSVTPGTGGASYGIYATGAGNIYNNIITENANSGSNGSYYAIYANAGGNIYGNEIDSNITGTSSSANYGIYTLGGAASIYKNTIYELITAGSGVVQGIALAATTNVMYSVYQNKIYGLTSTSNSSVVSGIVQSGASTATIDNNLIGLLTSGASTTTTNGINGINITSSTTGTTSNIYHNSIYLSATSTGGTNCILLNTAVSATVANNLLVNLSGAGTTTNRAACLLKRTSATFTTYMPASDHNFFFLGAPGTYRYVYYDGTTAHQSLPMFQLYAVNQDQSSISQNITFASLTGSATNFLLPQDTTYTESAGKIIAGLERDYTTTNPRATYPITGQLNGGGGAPDIGAYEADHIFVDIFPPSIHFTPIGKSLISSTKLLDSVKIFDPSGINLGSGSVPRLYYKKSTETNALAFTNNASANGWKYVETPNTSYPYTFVIDYSLLYLTGAVSDGDIIQYFVVAQDNSTTPKVGIKGAALAAAAPSVVLTSAQFPVTTGYSYTLKSAGIPASVTVGSGSTYTSFTQPGGLFEAINNGIVTGNITATVTSDILTETGTIALNKFTEEGPGVGTYTLTIQPAAPTVYTISGTYSLGGLFRLMDVSRVTFDGSFLGAGRYLNFANKAVTGSNAVFQLSGSTPVLGCDNVNIKNCTIWTDTAYMSGNNGIFIGGTTIGVSTGTQQGISNRNITIANNSISKAFNGILVNGSASVPSTNISITDNEIGHDSSTKYIGANGIFLRGVTNSKISGNKIFNIINPYNNVLSAINCDQDVTQTALSANKISNIVHTAAASVAVYGIYSKTATNNFLTISNNAISKILGQGASTDIATGPVALFINNGDNSKILNNSVTLSGNRLENTVGGAYSACLYVRNTVANLTVSNNIFKNVMTSSNTVGVGNNFAIVTGSTNVNSFGVLNNNLYYVGSTTPGMVSALALTGSTVRADLHAWRQYSLLDKNSLWGEPGYLADSIVEPNPSDINVWHINGRGYPMAAVDKDILNNPRSTTLAGGSTDIGAYEVTPVSVPPNANATALPAPNTTTYYTLGNDTLASMAWAAASTVPSSISVKYYSGTIPPSTTSGSRYLNTYWDIQAVPSTGLNYTLTLFYKGESMHTLNAESALAMAQKDGSNPWNPFLAGATVLNTTLDRMAVAGMPNVGIFTGTDTSVSLPVTLIGFTGKRMHEDVQLRWTTVSEKDFSLFTIERSDDGKTFEAIGDVKAIGNSNTTHHYQFIDANAKQPDLFYRLHLVDNDGTSDYSTIIHLTDGETSGEETFMVYPNPFSEKIVVTIAGNDSRVISLKDVTGKTMYEQTITGAGNHEVTIPYYVNAGIYFLHDSGTGKTTKVIRE
ncbi:MAG: T9SS type A sorting domain-containing protein [Bacteroidota bacterium]